MRVPVPVSARSSRPYTRYLGSPWENLQCAAISTARLATTEPVQDCSAGRAPPVRCWEMMNGYLATVVCVPPMTAVPVSPVTAVAPTVVDTDEPAATEPLDGVALRLKSPGTSPLTANATSVPRVASVPLPVTVIR